MGHDHYMTDNEINIISNKNKCINRRMAFKFF